MDQKSKHETKLQEPRLVAVIDIGATSVRMAISQVDARGRIENLESLSQAVSLGRDSFVHGRIDPRTIEECVRVLKIYRTKLREFRITKKSDIHVVATSAVREARNRLAFLDRIYIATGFEVEPFDQAELHRVTFLGIQPLLKSFDELAQGENVFCEIGGGSTEILVVDQGNVLFAETYRMGALRLSRTLEAYNAPISKLRQIMLGQISQFLQRFQRSVPELRSPRFIGMGGDLRFVLSQLYPDDVGADLKKISLSKFSEFSDEIINTPSDQLVNRYSLSIPEAESLGPALLANVELARSLGVEEIFISNVNMREGLIREMTQMNAWNDEFRDQVLRYSMNLGRVFQFDEEFAVHVAQLCHLLFEELQTEHELDARYGLILYVAGLLHEVGQFVNHRAYHKHTMYLLRNSDFFGLGMKDVLLIALVARYHRRAHPQPGHEGFSSLDRTERVAVSKMAAILRVAIALNVTRQQRVQSVICDIGEELISLRIPAADLSMERLDLEQNASLFRETFGKKITLTEI